MSRLHSAERVGEAWRMHRDGNNDGAIALFSEIIETAPDSVDARYGLGLSYKANGDTARAAEAFQTALDLAQQALNAVNTTSGADGHHGTNDLNTNEDDRFMMLSRMLKQRIDDVSSSVS